MVRYTINLISIIMGLVEQRGIMNTNAMNKLTTGYLIDLKGSDYEFNRYDKTALKCIVNVVKLLVVTESYSNWSEAVSLVVEALTDRFFSGGKEVYCFIASPTWKKNTSIVRHYGLARSLAKEFDVEALDYLFERMIVNDSDVAFYGVVKLTAENARTIFSLLSVNENGVLFSNQGLDNFNFSLLVEELSSLVSIKSKSMTVNLNVVEAINLILREGMIAILPYAWEETGEYHLDIFESG